MTEKNLGWSKAYEFAFVRRWAITAGHLYNLIKVLLINKARTFQNTCIGNILPTTFPELTTGEFNAKTCGPQSTKRVESARLVLLPPTHILMTLSRSRATQQWSRMVDFDAGAGDTGAGCATAPLLFT